MDNLLTSTKKLGTSCVEKILKCKIQNKVNNTKSTKLKSCTQGFKTGTTMYKQSRNHKNGATKARGTYTQVMQKTNAITKTNKQLSHISTDTSNTSSVINIYKTEPLKITLLMKLLKGVSTTKIHTWQN